MTIALVVAVGTDVSAGAGDAVTLAVRVAVAVGTLTIVDGWAAVAADVIVNGVVG